MNDQASRQNPNPPAQPDPGISRTFFIAEIRGGSELHDAASRLMELSVATAVETVRGILGHRKGAPEIEMHRPPTVQA